MQLNSLVQFGSSSDVVTKQSKTGGTTVRLLTAKEFKTARGLKGNEASREYNAYLREQGRANTAGLAAAMSTGQLLVKRLTGTKNGCTVGFVFADGLKDPKAKSESKQLSAGEIIALAKGLDRQELLLGLGIAQ